MTLNTGSNFPLLSPATLYSSCCLEGQHQQQQFLLLEGESADQPSSGKPPEFMRMPQSYCESSPNGKCAVGKASSVVASSLDAAAMTTESACRLIVSGTSHRIDVSCVAGIFHRSGRVQEGCVWRWSNWLRIKKELPDCGWCLWLKSAVALQSANPSKVNRGL